MRAKQSALVFLLGLGACAAQQDWRGDPQLAHQLSAHMAKDELKRLLGEPSDVMQMRVMGSSMETWTYNGRQKIRLSLQDGRLIGAQLDGRAVVDAKGPRP